MNEIHSASAVVTTQQYDKKNVIFFENEILKRNGSDGRTRTCDQAINSRLLYQLSYI